MSLDVKNPAKLLGFVLLFGGLIVLVKLFFVPLSQEVKYFSQTALEIESNVLKPPNLDYAIVIPKINASAPIIDNVDPLDSATYQRALMRGVAHASGTAHPGDGSNIFLFAHSSADLFTASQYNSVFYLVHHLEEGDEIMVWYKGKEFRYRVTLKEYVSATETKYLTDKLSTETLTLMTCWPPGTTLGRLIVRATPIR